MFWELFLTILLLANSFGDALLISVTLVSLRSLTRDAVSVFVCSALEAHSFSPLHQLMSSGNNGMEEVVNLQCISLSPRALLALAEFLQIDPVGRGNFFLSNECIARIRSWPSADRWRRILPPDLEPCASDHRHLQQVLEHYEELDAQSRWTAIYPFSSLPWSRIIRQGETFPHTLLLSDVMHLMCLASYCDDCGIGEREVVGAITMLKEYSLANAKDITRALPPVMAIVMIVMKRERLWEDQIFEGTLNTIARASNALRNVADTVVQPDTFEHKLLRWAEDAVRYKGAVAFSRNSHKDSPIQPNLSMEELLPMVKGKPFAVLCLWTVLVWNIKDRSTAIKVTRTNLSRTILLALTDNFNFAKYLSLLRSLRTKPTPITQVLDTEEIRERLLKLPLEFIPSDVFPQPPQHIQFVLEYAKRWIFAYNDGWYDRLRGRRSVDKFLKELLRADTIPYYMIPPHRIAAYGERSTEELLRNALEFALCTTQTFKVEQRPANETAPTESTSRLVIVMQEGGSPYDDVIIVDLIILLTLHYPNPLTLSAEVS